MGQFAVFRWGIVATAFAIWGCSTPPKGSFFSWNLGRGKQGPIDKAVEAKQRTESSKKSVDQAVKTSVAEKSDETDEKKTSPESKSGERQVVTHDAATMKLISEELKDASPEERKELFNDLKGLEPAMVRQVLRARRLVSRMGQKGSRVEGRGLRVEGRGLRVEGRGSTTALAAQNLLAADGFLGVGHLGNGLQQTAASTGLGTTGPWSRTHRAAGTEPAGVPSSPSSNLQIDPANRSTRAADAMHSNRAMPNPDVQQVGAAGGGRVNPSGSGLFAFAAGNPVAQAPGGQNPRQPGNGSNDLQKVISAAEAEIAQLGPGNTEAELMDYIQKHVNLRWLYLMSGQQERALQPIPGLPSVADQEFWTQMFWAVSNYFDSEFMPNDADRATQTVNQLRSAILRLQDKAKLELRNVSFSRNISSFGNYERFNRDEFSPGEPVLLYAEVSNFKSELTADGQYRTLLKSTIEIYDARGGLVQRIPIPLSEDLCHNYRRDYFHSYEFSIPQRIPLGPHVLKLTVEDRLGNKMATYSLNFTVK